MPNPMKGLMPRRLFYMLHEGRDIDEDVIIKGPGRPHQIGQALDGREGLAFTGTPELQDPDVKTTPVKILGE